jgi:hypothetical protein
MAPCLNTLGTSVRWVVLRKGARIFGLLGKATRFGLASFARQDIAHSWALTSEMGCLRLERLSGDEEVLGDELVLPTAFAYDYGLNGPNNSPEATRAVFGLLPSELELLVIRLRRGSFPVLGFSHLDQRCSVSSCIITGCWPHLVVSNLALYGNVVSLECFTRILVSSLPHGQLGVRHPDLQPVIKHMVAMRVAPIRGVPYCKEMLEMAPSAAPAPLQG